MERALPGAAGDPPLPRARRRPLRPAPRHPLDTRVTSAVLRRAIRPLDASRTDAGDERHRPLLRHGHRLPVGAARRPRSPASDTFAGEIYHTGRWPHEGVDFTGKRVGRHRHRLVRRPGDPGHRRSRPPRSRCSSARRTSACPRWNGPLDPTTAREVKRRLRRARAGRSASRSRASPTPSNDKRRARGRPTRSASASSRRATSAGGLDHGRLLHRHHDRPDGQRARRRVRPRQDPRARRGSGRSPRCSCRARTRSAPSGRASTPTTTRRSTEDHVSLVDLQADADRGDRRRAACARATRTYEVDAIVFATGFDAMTGALIAIDIRGRDGAALRDQWAGRPAHLPRHRRRRLPEPVPRHRPGQPVGAQQHGRVRSSSTSTGSPTRSRTSTARSCGRIEPTEEAQDAWVAHVGEIARRDALAAGATRGTWARTSPASRACSCPTSAAWARTASGATRSRPRATRASRWPEASAAHRGPRDARRPLHAVDPHHDLVGEAPGPVLAGLERADDRMAGRLRVRGRVLARRVVAAADVPALEADAQVAPDAAVAQALLAAVGRLRQLA